MSFLTLKHYVSPFDIPFWVFENCVPKFVFQNIIAFLVKLSSRSCKVGSWGEAVSKILHATAHIILCLTPEDEFNIKRSGQVSLACIGLLTVFPSVYNGHLTLQSRKPWFLLSSLSPPADFLPSQWKWLFLLS